MSDQNGTTVVVEEIIEGKQGTVVEGANSASTAQTTATNLPSMQSGNGTLGLGGSSEISLEDNIDLGNLEKFPKLAKDETARIAFCCFDGKGAPRIRMAQVFYIESLKKSFVAPENPQLLAECVKLLGEPKIRFGTVIAKYQTDKAGNVLSPDLEHLAFVFGTDKFPILKSLHKEWSLSTRDITLQCTEADFQKISFLPCNESLMGANPEFKAAAIAKANDLFEKHLEKRICRKLPDNEIVVILNQLRSVEGSASAAAQFASAGNNPFAANSGGQAAAGFQTPNTAGGAASGEDFSNLLSKESQQ
jgi:hypothetical protein